VAVDIGTCIEYMFLIWNGNNASSCSMAKANTKTYSLYEDNVLFRRKNLAVGYCRAKLGVALIVLSSVHCSISSVLYECFKWVWGVLPATIPRHQRLLLDSCTNHYNNDMHATTSIAYYSMPPWNQYSTINEISRPGMGEGDEVLSTRVSTVEMCRQR
jgi:hypothetical protein